MVKTPLPMGTYAWQIAETFGQRGPTLQRVPKISVRSPSNAANWRWERHGEDDCNRLLSQKWVGYLNLAISAALVIKHPITLVVNRRMTSTSTGLAYTQKNSAKMKVSFWRAFFLPSLTLYYTPLRGTPSKLSVNHFFRQGAQRIAAWLAASPSRLKKPVPSSNSWKTSSRRWSKKTANRLKYRSTGCNLKKKEAWMPPIVWEVIRSKEKTRKRWAPQSRTRTNCYQSIIIHIFPHHQPQASRIEQKHQNDRRCIEICCHSSTLPTTTHDPFTAIGGWTMPRHSTVRLWKIMAKISQSTTRDNLKDSCDVCSHPTIYWKSQDIWRLVRVMNRIPRWGGSKVPWLPVSKTDFALLCIARPPTQEPLGRLPQICRALLQHAKDRDILCRSVSTASHSNLSGESVGKKRRYHAAEFSSSSAFSTEVAQICRALCTCHRWCEE